VYIVFVTLFYNILTSNTKSQ